MFPGIGNRVSAPCGHQTQPQRMIVLQPPLVRHFFEQHQMLKREVVCIIDNQMNVPPRAARSGRVKYGWDDPVQHPGQGPQA